MSRSGYSDDGEYLNLYRGSVNRAIKGRRGQVFLTGLAKALDEMPMKRLIRGELQNVDGEVCAIGAYCALHRIDTSKTDYENPKKVADLVGIAPCLAAEIEFENDDDFGWNGIIEPEQRWVRMRKWVDENLKK